MTDKEIRKLKRADLLEILYYLQKEIEELNKENESLKSQLENSKIILSESELEKIVDAVKAAVTGTAQNNTNEPTIDDANSNEEEKQNNGDGKTNEA